MTSVPGSAIVYLPGSIQVRAFKIPSLHLIAPEGHFALWDWVLNPIITNYVNKSQVVL